RGQLPAPAGLLPGHPVPDDQPGGGARPGGAEPGDAAAALPRPGRGGADGDLADDVRGGGHDADRGGEGGAGPERRQRPGDPQPEGGGEDPVRGRAGNAGADAWGAGVRQRGRVSGRAEAPAPSLTLPVFGPSFTPLLSASGIDQARRPDELG